MLAPDHICKYQYFSALPRKVRINILRKWREENFLKLLLGYLGYVLFMIPLLKYWIKASDNVAIIALGVGLFSFGLSTFISIIFNKLTQGQQLDFIEGLDKMPHDEASQNSVCKFAEKWYQKFTRS